MSLTDAYLDRFQNREQHDAHNPNQRTMFDEFGHPKDVPTVEGFDAWGPNPYQRPVPVEAPVRVRMSNAEARKSLNFKLKSLRKLA